MPTIARSARPSWRSTISWAIRTRVRRMSSPSRTTLPSSFTCLPSFLASRDRVKGARRAAAARRPGTLAPRSHGTTAAVALLGVRDDDRVEVARRRGRGRTPSRASSQHQRAAGSGWRGAFSDEQPGPRPRARPRRPGAPCCGRSRPRARRPPRGTSPRGRARRRRARDSRTMSHGRGVAGEDDAAPRRGPRRSRPAGRTPPTVSPACRRPKSGPGATPSAAARSASKRPGRSCSTSA